MNYTAYPELARIDGQAINIATPDQAVAAAISHAEDGRGFRLFTLNLDHLVKRRDEEAFRDAYRQAELVTADGAPVALLARRQHAGIIRTTGADLVVPLCGAAARAGISVAFFGSNDGTLEISSAALLRQFPDLIIAHREAPPYGFDPQSDLAEHAAARIAESGARIAFVALGAPKQELFAHHMAHQFPQLGFVCIGAALDFIAGTQIRAPRLFRAIGMEWLWRLGTNPARLARRYAACAALLASLIVAIGAGRAA